MKKTPMMKQYLNIKRQYPDKLVLFRMGDFYESFGDDAKLASKVLNITLTTRDKGNDPTPMAGFPHHSLDQYLAKIIKSGNCAVVVDQLEDPKEAKGVVKRGVTRIVTPGTLDGELADTTKSPYLMSVYIENGTLGISVADLSTGEFKITEVENTTDNLETLLSSQDPSEILIHESEEQLDFPNIPVQVVESKLIKSDRAEKFIKEFFNVKSLESLFISEYQTAVKSAALLLEYISETQKMNPEHISRPTYFSNSGKMVLDRSTVRNLDLVINSYNRGTEDSLLGVMDNTKTVMGKRKLYSWILNPLIEKEEIDSRLNITETFYDNSELLKEIRSKLNSVSDTERIVGKIGLNRANARDLKSLQESLEAVKEISEEIKNSKKLNELTSINRFFSKNDSHKDISELIKIIDRSVADSPPTTLTEGNIVKEGYNKKVDELRNITGNSKDWIKEFEEEEKKRTEIPSLKIGMNKVFGYYIEVTKTHTDKVPEEYVRKQTLVNSERYITDELKKKEDTILNAEEELGELEYKLFQEIRESLFPYLDDIKELSQEVAKLDILAGFASNARKHYYNKPVIFSPEEKKGILNIENGRHPVVEIISEEEFISNDTYVTNVENRLAIITGPNMSGKSTFIRQVALLVLMAQIGSFVPADKLELSIVDRVFSRVGASDNLSEGRSTFMVEMEEAANILNNATENSLIILDEVGRGTSTYDGMSIAWALSEYLIHEVKARTLFATHYHELLKLEEEHPEFVKNLNVDVSEDEENGDITFLRKIVEGGTDRSYGIYVAKLAGLPQPVVERARDILEHLEDENGEKEISASESTSSKESSKIKKNSPADVEPQLSFFGHQESELQSKLEELDIENMTPVEALNILNELKKIADK